MKSEFKKIAIICASERELAPFLPLIENPTVSERAMLRIHEGRLNGFDVAAVYCGVCKVNAAAAAQIMFIYLFMSFCSYCQLFPVVRN